MSKIKYFFQVYCLLLQNLKMTLQHILPSKRAKCKISYDLCMLSKNKRKKNEVYIYK